MVRKILLCFFVFACGRLFAQDVTSRQTIDDSALEYQHVAGQQAAIYFGSLKEGLLRTTNHPFLIIILYY